MTEKTVALVTGANRGLGFETSRQLGKMGISLLMGCRNTARGMAAARRLRAEGLDAEFVMLDVTKPEQIRQVERHIRKHFGRLDILVNNAGMAHKEEPLFMNSTET
ncbi:MAG: SDR family NAD(P)-dependent oxidoreductase, partial [Desulfobacteraceae bacterium]